MKNFWTKLQPPFTVLAPMDGVTDTVFRQIIAKIGRPDVFFTEFASCEGLLSGGRKKVSQSLKFHPNEKPIVAQIWGEKPQIFYKVAKIVRNLGFSGIDINMGCPDRSVVKIGAGAALIKNHPLAKKIIEAVKEGAGSLPVSVKTRIGFEKEQIDEWISFLLSQNLQALTIHLRTAKELSNPPAHWELMSKIVKLRNSISEKTILIGNGGILTLSEISEKHAKYNCEGFMVGEGIFKNPWLFNKNVNYKNISAKDGLELYLEHIKLFEKTWGKNKDPESLKKFCKTYINNFSKASKLRVEIMKAKTTKDFAKIIKNHLKNH